MSKENELLLPRTAVFKLIKDLLPSGGLQYFNLTWSCLKIILLKIIFTVYKTFVAPMTLRSL
jgi:hypothetical protein